ncbi:SPFH domain-containing protein [Streptomyces sp. NPDC052179]|uniref:SPFH domain-containing protein n=1 Tax=Streptomyces sp. NPDC052179 TaxID=3155680 RepID=UPI00343182D7
MRPTVSDSSGPPENGKEREPVNADENHPRPARPSGQPERSGQPRPAPRGPGTAPSPAGSALPWPTEGQASPTSPARTDGSDTARTAPDADGPGLDLVLDLAPGGSVAAGGAVVRGGAVVPGAATAPGRAVASALGAVSATVSVPVRGADGPFGRGGGGPDTGITPVTLPAAAGDSRREAGRRHSVIANETTASIPVHLLFRDEREDTGAATLPAAVAGRPSHAERTPGVRRPPEPRAPRAPAHARAQVQAPTRPSPLGDPRLAERPGPVLPGWAALLTGAAGLAAGLATLWWVGALPAAALARLGLGSRPYHGIGIGAWAVLALLVTVVLFALGGLGRGRVGYAWVLTLFGDYRGSVRRTGLLWVSPLLLRRRVDVRLRHWRSESLRAVDANGTALRVVVLVVWRIKDTVRAALGVADHEEYLREQVEAAMARVLSQLPADAFHEDAPTLRDAEAVGDALTRMLKADCEPVGIEVYSAQPTGIEYAPEVAAAMQRRRVAAIDAKHRDSVLTSVVDAVDDTVNRLTSRGIVELDDYERKALVKDLTVAFYTGRSGGDGA